MALPQVSMECRAGKDPELRFGPSGTAVAHLRVAASSRKLQDDGTWADDKTCWVDVSAFGSLAENIAESVVQGDLLTVTGRLVTEEWQDRETGQRRSRNDVLADSVAVSLRFRPVRHGESRQQSERPQQQRPQQGQQQQRQQPANVGVNQEQDPPF
jgi:single-strand DNA-binding protein